MEKDSDSAACAPDVYSYVQMRRAYQAEISHLRKQFMEHEKRMKKKREMDAKLSRSKIMKEKAARLKIREKRREEKAIELAKEREIKEKELMTDFDQKMQIRRLNEEEKDRRRNAILKAYTRESKGWITCENYEARLQEDLFMYTRQLRHEPRSFDVLLSTAGSSALSWLEKLKQMKPAGAQDIATTNVSIDEEEKKSILDFLPKKDGGDRT